MWVEATFYEWKSPIEQNHSYLASLVTTAAVAEIAL